MTKKRIIILIIAAIVLVGAGFGAWWLFHPREREENISCTGLYFLLNEPAGATAAEVRVSGKVTERRTGEWSFTGKLTVELPDGTVLGGDNLVGTHHSGEALSVFSPVSAAENVAVGQAECGFGSFAAHMGEGYIVWTGADVPTYEEANAIAAERLFGR